MNRTKIIEVIYTQERRGMGVESDPVRLVTQLWSKEGNLIAEHDPVMCVEDKERMQEIIQEVTKQIQSDLLKEILGKESLVSGMIWIGDIKKLAEEKEITLN